MTRLNGHSESKSSSSGNLSVLTENTTKASLGRLSISQNTELIMKETKSLGRLSVSQNSDPVDKETKCLACMTNFFCCSFFFLIISRSLLVFTPCICFMCVCVLLGEKSFSLSFRF